MRLKLSIFITFLIFGCATIPLNELDEAIQKGNLNQVVSIIEKDSRPLNVKDITGRSPLHNATDLGHVEIIQYLVKQGADVNSKSTRTIRTPLHIAATHGNLEVVKYLVSNGAKLNVKDYDGNTPLHNALYFIWGKESEFDNIEMVKYLVDNGANVNSTNYINKETPLHVAAFLGLHETTRYLVEHNAAVNAKNINGNTPLHNAASKGHLKIVEYLISKGSNIRATNKYKATPFHLAASSGNKKLVVYLISKGVNIEAKDNDGRTPLDYAQQMAKVEIVELLNLKLKPFDKNYLGEIKKETKKNIVFQKDDEKSETFLEKSKPAIPAIDFGQYFALVIGNNNYQYLPKLNTAKSDAKEIAALLTNYYGFRVDLLTDATRSDILLALGKLRKKLTKRDNLLIYYAGHGWMDEEEDEGYWLPIDATEQNIINWVSNSSITNTLRAIQAKHVLVVADSCYSGKLSRGIHAVKRTPGYLERISIKKARSVLSSGGLEPVADTGYKRNHSVFASAFIDALKENTGVIDGTELFSKIRRPVMLNSDQTPEYSDIRKAGHDGGDFLFVRVR